MNHFNGLSPAEQERLAILSEELGECVQAIGKILRHGYESYHPHFPDRGTNRRQLERELGDVLFAMTLISEAGDLSMESIYERAREKDETTRQYLHHQDIPSATRE